MDMDADGELSEGRPPGRPAGAAGLTAFLSRQAVLSFRVDVLAGHLSEHDEY